MVQKSRRRVTPVNPGLQLKAWLHKRYRRSEGPSWVEQVTNDFATDELADRLFDGTMYLLARKMISTLFIYERSFPDTYMDKYEQGYLRNTIGLTKKEASEIIGVVERAFKVASAPKKIPKGLATELLAHAREYQSDCELCGRQIDFDATKDSMERPSIDHIYPQSMGGATIVENLRVVCYKCDTKLQSTVDMADHHYERFVLKQLPDQRNYLTEFEWVSRCVTVMRFNGTCKCGAPLTVGEGRSRLDYAPIDEHRAVDSFNIRPLCSRCAVGARFSPSS